MGQQLFGRGERERLFGLIRDDALPPFAVRLRQETAADGVIRRPDPFIALPVIGREHEAVGVIRQVLAAMEEHILGRIERQFPSAGQNQHPPVTHLPHPLVRRVGIHRLRGLAHQSQHHRLVAAVSLARSRQRAIQRCLQPSQFIQDWPIQLFQKPAGGAHRTDRMRTGRTDADTEQIKNADGHGPFLPMWFRDNVCIPLTDLFPNQ